MACVYFKHTFTSMQVISLLDPTSVSSLKTGCSADTGNCKHALVTKKSFHELDFDDDENKYLLFRNGV